MRPEIREILGSVRSPFRYVGGEVGSRMKDWETASARVCLAFPEIYEIGMSHLGLSILYKALNDDERFLAERSFMPWADMEAELRSRKIPLFSLESQRGLAEFDVLGFSLCYELTYTNVLTMLELSGVPLRSESRIPSHESRVPLVIAGGPCAFNPMPVAPFFDAIVAGDGEGAILSIAEAVAEWKSSGLPRMKLLENIADMRGVYVPLIHDPRSTIHDQRSTDFVGRARVADLDLAPFPESPVVPHVATQERLAVEVARGCTRGCRFCQAGYVYRPLRQRSGNSACGLASRGLAATGAEEFSFLSLSIGDWAPLPSALDAVHAISGEAPANATLPSLRAESLTEGLVEKLGAARAGSFTLAPEAATERMRRFINKGNTDEDLYASVEKVFAGGWRAIKLYFMVGLPGETDEDVEGIVRIANRCLDIGRRHHKRPDVTVSTSTFIPKAHTPFQWEGQISIERAEEIQRLLKKKLRRPGLYYRWHDARMSFLEGIFSRGGAELSAAIEIAQKKGARFDGWDECMKWDLWREALREAGIEAASYLKGRSREEILPWEGLGLGPDREFLLSEFARAQELAATSDCATGSCSRCGMCDFKEIKNRVAANPESRDPKSEIRDPEPGTPIAEQTSQTPGLGSRVSGAGTRIFRYRVRYTKKGRSAFLGSIETLDALRRGLRAAGLPLIYSEGFHPRPRVSVGPAPTLGIESEAEFVDISLREAMPPDEIVSRMRGRLPLGMEVVEAYPLAAGSPSVEEGVSLMRFEADFAGTGVDPNEVCRRFAAAGSLKAARTRRGKKEEAELKDYVDELAVRPPCVLEVALRQLKPALRIGEALAGLSGLGEEAVRALPIRKTGVKWQAEAPQVNGRQGCPTNS